MSRFYRRLTKVEIKYFIPMIGMISSGKTSIIKDIYGIDFLEVSAGIGTKFVNIIRHNPKVGNEPKFYHLIVKKSLNEKYEFFKDPNFKEVIGSENIKKQIKELNDKYKKKENVPYEDLFYMVEVGQANLIVDEEFLKNFDIVDTPGLSEFKFHENDKGEAPVAGKEETEEKKNIHDSIETTMKSYDPKSEQTYLTEFFKIMKDYIKKGIIVFSVDNLQIAENYEIIGKLQKVLDKPIENFLVLLNKIDKSDDVDLEIATLEGKILKFFPSAKLFNFTKNVIVPISSYQLENESKIESSFHYFLNYHFLNFLMGFKKDTPGNPYTTINGFSFIDFLKKINPLKKITKKKYEELLNKIFNNENLEKILEEIKSVIVYIINNNKSYKNLNLGVRPDDFEKSKIEKLKQKIKEDKGENEEEEEEENESFNINEQDEKGIILYYYSLFINKNKKIFPEKSEEYLKIVKYFIFEKKPDDSVVIKREKEFKIFLEKLKFQINKINDLSKRMKEFYDIISREAIRPINMKLLNLYINNSINILKASQYFYIPLLGVSNAGKSTLINTKIGYKLLPAHKNECTKKGILIKHWNWPEPALRRTYFREVESINKEKFYCFEPEEKHIALGVEEIQRTLEASNYEFSQNSEDFFFEIDVKMRFIEELNIDNDLKEKICFIDLPGYGTNNEFEERDIYTNLIKSCNLFIFVVFNLTIKENNNQNMLNKLFKKLTKSRGVTTNGFLKKCLFIVNADEKQEISEKTLNQAKADILSITTNKVDKKDFKDINICFYNALFYENYLFKLMYYQSGVNIMKTEYMAYKNEKAKFWKNLISEFRYGSFNNYLLKNLNDKIKKDIQIPFEEDEVSPNESIEKSINDFLKVNLLKFKPTEITLISKYITFGSENIINSNLKFESNYDNFKNILYNCIKEAKSQEDKEINENLINCFKIFDNFFEVDPDTLFGKCRNAPNPKIIKPHMEKDMDYMKTEVGKYLELINKEFIDHDIIKVLTDGKEKISDSLIKEQSNISTNLKEKNWKEVQKQFQTLFENKTEELKNNLLETLKISTENIKKFNYECYNVLDKFFFKPCEKKHKLYKDYISEKLGGSDKIEKTMDDLKTDIIKSSNTATDWENNSFFSWIKQKIFDENYLNRIITFISNESNERIKSFIDSISTYSSEYKTMIIDEINSSKTRVEDEMERRIKEENIKIQMINAKNDEERKKWLKEKEIYDSTIKAWEEVCKRYRKLRDEITEIRITTL